MHVLPFPRRRSTGRTGPCRSSPALPTARFRDPAGRPVLLPHPPPRTLTDRRTGQRRVASVGCEPRPQSGIVEFAHEPYGFCVLPHDRDTVRAPRGAAD
jgi:hypothetical protein